jgi:hypothetical protein
MDFVATDYITLSEGKKKWRLSDVSLNLHDF